MEAAREATHAFLDEDAARRRLGVLARVEGGMIAWIVRVLLAAAASVTQWFVAPTSPNFGVVQGLISLGIFAVVVFVLALWPWRGRD